MSFYALQVSLEKIYYTFVEEPHKRFWTRLKENAFAFVKKYLEHLESWEILCVHRSKILDVSAVPGFKNFREGIRCLFNNVFDRLFEETSQSTNDLWVHTLRQSTSSDLRPICAISVLTYITSQRDLKRRMCWCWNSSSRPSLL